MNAMVTPTVGRDVKQTALAVGLGQLGMADAQGELVTYGLGSCIGLVLWAERKKVGTLCHIVMPASRGRSFDNANPAKYADWAVPEALKVLRSRGVRLGDVVAKVAGGARTLGTLSSDIGHQNTEATLEMLADYRIKVTARSVGGTVGRTIRFYPETGLVEVRLVGGARSTL